MMELTEEQHKKESHFFITEFTSPRGDKTYYAVPKFKSFVFGNSDEYESVYGKITLKSDTKDGLLDLIMKAEPLVV